MWTTNKFVKVSEYMFAAWKPTWDCQRYPNRPMIRIQAAMKGTSWGSDSGFCIHGFLWEVMESVPLPNRKTISACPQIRGVAPHLKKSIDFLSGPKRLCRILHVPIECHWCTNLSIIFPTMTNYHELSMATNSHKYGKSPFLFMGNLTISVAIYSDMTSGIPWIRLCQIEPPERTACSWYFPQFQGVSRRSCEGGLWILPSMGSYRGFS